MPGFIKRHEGGVKRPERGWKKIDNKGACKGRQDGVERQARGCKKGRQGEIK